MRSLIMIGAALLLGAPLAAQDADDPAAVVYELFEHMKAGNADGMAALMHEDARLVTTGVRDGVPVVRTVEISGWLDGVRNSTRELDEQLYDVEVHRAQGLAVVWTGYSLYVDGEFSHCGVDAFQLVLTEAGWRILEIADTRKREGCPGA